MDYKRAQNQTVVSKVFHVFKYVLLIFIINSDNVFLHTSCSTTAPVQSTRGSDVESEFV